jgi:prepilin peptidase CpaA
VFLRDFCQGTAGQASSGTLFQQAATGKHAVFVTIDAHDQVGNRIMPWIVFAFLILAAVWDIRTREIPDWISLAILLTVIVAVALGHGPVHWGNMLGGLFLGFCCSAPLFWLGGFGGADVKLIAAVGASLGPVGLLCMFFWMAMAGAALAIFAKVRRQKDFAYAPAIAFGFLVQSLWSEGLCHVLLRR